MHTNNTITGISFNSDDALYLQIADYYRRQVALGRLRPGARLPAIRELAQRLNLDPGTVARAYRELERQGTIYSRRGGGSFISTNTNQKDLTEQQRKKLDTLLEKTVLEAFGLGFSTEDIETAFTLHMAEWRERRIKSKLRKTKKTSKWANEIRFSGSHDIAVELLANHLNSLYPDTRLTASFVGSLAGLIALEQGEADIAGAHLLDRDSGEYNVPFIKKLMPYETVILINLMQRVQGLIVAPGNPKFIKGINDLKRDDVTFINRQKGSGTRILLDSQLLGMDIKPDDIRGYEREEKTHIAVASLVADGQADVALGAQSAAKNAKLDFIPLFKERYDLVMLEERLEEPRISRIMEVVCSESYQNMLLLLPGYDLTQTGKVTKIKPQTI